jgi:carbonic anhydrase
MTALRAALVVSSLLVAATPVQTASADGGAAQSLARLKEGNARFVAEPTASLPIGEKRREALTRGQDPFALVLSCADSRVPPEIVFHAGLGDLFVVRSAGEVLDRAVLASLEYGAEHLKAPLLVVMGHEFCGAVKAAAETGPGAKSAGPNLDFLIRAIQPAVARTQKTLFEEPLKAAVLANVEQVVGELQTQSAILRERVEAGELTIIGAYYQLSSGQVTFSQPVSGPSPKPAAPPVPQTKRQQRPMIEIQELLRDTPATTSAPAAPKPSGPKPAESKPAESKHPH